MNTTKLPQDTEAPAVGVPVERVVRPYATSVKWTNGQGGSWQQWHDDEDPMPTEWDDRPPDEVVHVYTAAQVAELLAAERERCAKLVQNMDTTGHDGYIETTGDLCEALAACIRRA